MIIKPESGNNSPLFIDSENVYYRRSHLLGTKAKTLCLLSSAGAPVPDFRVLSSEAFFLMLRYNGIKIEYQPRNRTKKLAEIREQIIQSDISPVLENRIFNFLEQNKQLQSFAVRLSYSSPVKLAHPPHFFRLNLKTPRSVINAVKRCWAACFSELFFNPNLFDTQCVNKRGPAVIIQSMINGSVSGVFYSQSTDPGEENVSVLKWCKGLGVNLREGSLCIEKIKDGRIIEKHDGSQKSYYDAAPKDGIQVLAINDDDDSASLLQENIRQKIISLGDKLNFLARPVMVSWTVSKNNVFILGQACCQTSAYMPENADSSLCRGERIWSSGFTSSLFPTPLSPLSYSLWHNELEKNWTRKLLPIIKLKKNKGYTWFRIINSRPYIDEECLTKIDSIKLSRFITTSILKSITGVAPVFAYRRFRKKMTRFLVQGNKYSIKNKSSKELIGRIKKTTRFLGRFSYIYFFTLIESILLTRFLENLLKLLFGGKHKRVLLVLLGNGSGGIYAQVRGNIEHISSILWSSEKFQDFLQSHKKKTFQEILREDSMGMPFLRACCRFNQKFGWLTESTDILAQPIEERSSRLFDLCSLFQRQKEFVKLHDVLLKRSKIREERYARIVNARLSRYVPGLGKLFFIFLRHVRKTIETVEDASVFVQKLLVGKRRIFLELGERLADKGKLAEAEDIFFLTWEEVTRGSLKKNVASKKEKFSLDKLKYHHSRYVEHGKHLAPLLRKVNSLIYQGYGTSHGCSVAPLAVRFPGEHLGDISGKILLTTSFNREWDFNILGAAGIITESGEVSGHAAYIARQHGIPAISGIPGLSLSMKDGDIVYINAFDGIVELLHPSSFGNTKNE